MTFEESQTCIMICSESKMNKMQKYESPLGGPLLAMSLRVAALVGEVLSWEPVLRAPGDGDPRPPKPGVQGARLQGALDHAWPGIGSMILANLSK